MITKMQASFGVAVGSWKVKMLVSQVIKLEISSKHASNCGLNIIRLLTKLSQREG